MSELRTGVKK